MQNELLSEYNNDGFIPWLLFVSGKFTVACEIRKKMMEEKDKQAETASKAAYQPTQKLYSIWVW